MTSFERILLGSLCCALALLVAGKGSAQMERPPESRPAADSRPATESAPATRAESRPDYGDVPAGSRDPVVDGMKSIIREMILKGLPLDQQPRLADRIVAILERGGLAEEGRQRVEADLMSKTLLDAQVDFRPKNAQPGRTALTGDEEQKVRVAAEALAKDLYLKLMPTPSGRHAAGQHTAAMRAAPQVNVPAGYQALSWKTLGGFEYTEGMKLPDEVLALNGAKVGIVGYMMTIEEVENIHEFLLVESFWSCCFGTPPTINQVLMIQIPGAKGVEYTSSPVLILGTLEVGAKVEDGFETSVYRLNATTVTATE
jgi:hypothetical protein